MTSSSDALLRRTERIIVEVQQGREHARVVCIYDPATGEPLPSYAPRADRVQIWLPDNGRGDLYYQQEEP